MKETSAKTYDVTVYDPGNSSVTYRDQDREFVRRARALAREHGWKVTVCDNQSKGNGRYR